MTEVIFHVNVPDACSHACGYVRKAHANARKVAVLGDAAQLQRVDAELWDGPRTAFLAHGVVGASSATVVEASPVVLGNDAARFPHRDILVNLTGQIPEGFEAFSRVVELVEAQEDALRASRLRWKSYRARGATLQSVDMAQLAGARREGA